jgi:hypothetical protein
VFDSPTCYRLLKETGMRTYLPSQLCKRCKNDIERQVTDSDWTNDLRTKSRYIYQRRCSELFKFQQNCNSLENLIELSCYLFINF